MTKHAQIANMRSRISLLTTMNENSEELIKDLTTQKDRRVLEITKLYGRLHDIRSG